MARETKSPRWHKTVPFIPVVPEDLLICLQSQQCPELNDSLYGHSNCAWNIKSEGEVEMGEMKMERGRGLSSEACESKFENIQLIGVCMVPSLGGHPLQI